MYYKKTYTDVYGEKITALVGKETESGSVWIGNNGDVMYVSFKISECLDEPSTEDEFKRFYGNAISKLVQI